MNPLQIIKSRFAISLSKMTDDVDDLLTMIRPAQDAKFGDYQANCAMPLSKRVDKPPRDVASELVDDTALSDFCSQVEVAGPGFVNITLDDNWISDQLKEALQDDRLGVQGTESPKTFVIDYSSPNVAKPMHVGHIRSTVIGDSLAKILRFLGHQVIADNHLGDWGTQFGMIIYGYKHFRDDAAYKAAPIQELSRIYRKVRQLMDYHSAIAALPKEEELAGKLQEKLTELESNTPEDKGAAKKHKKELKGVRSKLETNQQQIDSLKNKIASIQSDASLKGLASEHANIGQAVLEETAKLHSGDEENLNLWKEFLPLCHEDIQKIYDRLNIQFDHEHGESFYHDQLADVVADFKSSGTAVESDGAICIFLDNYDTPMIIQKSDGAYLYATTDLATIDYRMKTWKPDAMLYVVDFRQHEHFGKLFDVARAWKYDDVQYEHVSFGTVMGEDGKPFQTRAGDTVGLEGLLDEAEQTAYRIVAELDDQKNEQEFDENQRREIANVVGIGALKYADLSNNRSSDYKFSYEKMVAMDGNTATYLQYAYARVNGIFRKGIIDVDQMRSQPKDFVLDNVVERNLGVKLLRFEETLCDVITDYRPNLLTNYLYELAKTYASFFEQCPVLQADNEELKWSRLQLCDLTARTLKKGLELLGIDVVPKM